MKLDLWHIAFCAAAVFFLVGLFFFFCSSGSRKRGVVGILLTFLAGWALCIPYEYLVCIPKTLENAWMRGAEAVLTALVQTFTVYMGNGYNRYSVGGSPMFESTYAILSLLIDIVFMLYVLQFIVSLFDRQSQRMRFERRKHRKTYIFSSVNEKTLQIAASLPQEKRCVVFCTDSVPDEETKNKIQQINGVYLIHPANWAAAARRLCGRDAEVFLFEDPEEKNLQELKEICGGKKKSRGRIRVYAEVYNMPWQMVLDMPARENVTVNFVRTEENFAYNHLLCHSIFEDAIETQDRKVIKALLVGMNRITLEMLKAMLHLGQMPGYSLQVMVLDPGHERDSLRRQMPEVRAACHVHGDAEYTLFYKENVALSGCAVEEMIRREYPDFTFAFVNCGDDMENLNMAMRLNTLKQRRLQEDGYSIRVYTADRRSIEQSPGGIPAAIHPIGGMAELYDYGFIAMSRIEQATKKIHEVRYKDISWEAYCRNEYNRRSVYARTLSYKYRVELLESMYGGNKAAYEAYRATSKSREWRKYEHMRWNMYMRAMGYSLPEGELREQYEKLEEEKKDFGKNTPPWKELDNKIKKLQTATLTHMLLMPFEELPPDKWEKDALVLTDEIIEALKDKKHS